jgi:hypothetical protein
VHAACLLPPPALQAFHTLFHTDESVLLGAPTGSGKTISSELTMMRLWEAHPGDKVRQGGWLLLLLLLLLLVVVVVVVVVAVAHMTMLPAVRCCACS